MQPWLLNKISMKICNCLCILFLLSCSLEANSLRHCLVPNFNNNFQQGVVNIVYLTESSCKNCTAQIELLALIVEFLGEKGFPLIVTLSGEEPEYVPKGFLLDNGWFWNEFKRASGHVLIFDICGKFTYEVILPWSKLDKYPFVLAAILSTIVDRPCGGCKHHPIKNSFTEDLHSSIGHREEETSNVAKTHLPIFPLISNKIQLPKIVKKSKNGIVPLKIIFNTPHVHNGNMKIYNNFELETKNLDYHGHLPEDNANMNDNDRNQGHNKIQTMLTNKKLSVRTKNVHLLQKTLSNYPEKTDKFYEKDPITLIKNSQSNNMNNREEIQSSVRSQNMNIQNEERTKQFNALILNHASHNEKTQIHGKLDFDIKFEDYDKPKLLSHYNNLLKWSDFPLQKLGNLNNTIRF